MRVFKRKHIEIGINERVGKGDEVWMQWKFRLFVLSGNHSGTKTMRSTVGPRGTRQIGLEHWAERERKCGKLQRCALVSCPSQE